MQTTDHCQPPEIPDAAAVDAGSLRATIEVLESLVGNRALLDQLDADERARLVMAAGRVAKPDRIQITKLNKALRRERRRKHQTADQATKNSTEIRVARTTTVFIPPPQAADEVATKVLELNKPQNCYVCKAEYRTLHFFYDSMCESCATLNYAKRFQTSDLTGRVALITGARVKIGYQAALKLLRAGAKVVVTTRFPHDAAERYQQEADFADWGARLQIFGLDLRHAPSVEVFARYIAEQYDQLDFLLNNAAQTVRRPRGFYAHLLAAESVLPQNAAARRLLALYDSCRHRLQELPSSDAERGLLSYSADARGLVAPGLSESARMSQLPLLPDDLSSGENVFPSGQYDADRQQVDMRTVNSWRMRLADVPTAELLEIQLINAVAPFILCSQLKPLMLRSPHRDKHIVNVSAMEGKFSRYTKTDKHPHTNMAKAALNMMTQTSAPDYVRDGIHMNAVDTGWVTDEDPAAHAQRKREQLGFQPPLDVVDGAARICDPIFAGLNSGEHLWGKFLKDYMSTAW